MGQKLILIRGLPGSGKSTIAATLMLENPGKFVHYENDMFLYNENGDYVWTPKACREAMKRCKQETIKALSEGKNVIVSNCFLTIRSLNKYAKLVPEEDCTVIEAKGRFKSIHNVDSSLMASIYEPLY